MEQLNEIIKIILIGADNTGKTSIINTFMRSFENINGEENSAQYSSIEVKILEKNIRIEFCDVSGNEKYTHLIPIYLKNADISIICFDLSRMVYFN